MSDERDEDKERKKNALENTASEAPRNKVFAGGDPNAQGYAGDPPGSERVYGEKPLHFGPEAGKGEGSASSQGTPSDADVLDRVRARLSEIPEREADIDVSVEDGTLILMGEVADEAMRERLEEIGRETEGVTCVKNTTTLMRR